MLPKIICYLFGHDHGFDAIDILVYKIKKEAINANKLYFPKIFCKRCGKKF